MRGDFSSRIMGRYSNSDAGQEDFLDENERISPNYFGVLCFTIIGGFYFLLSSLERLLVQNALISVIICGIAGGFILKYYYFLHKKFSNKTFYQVIFEGFGRKFGKIILALYGIFYLLISAIGIWYISYFWTTLSMSKTPSYVYIFALFFLVYILAKLGIKGISRFSLIIIFSLIFFLAIIFAFMSGELSLARIFPLMTEVNLGDFIWLTLGFSLGIFGDLALLFPMHLQVENKMSIKKPSLIWSYAGIFFIFALIFVNLTTLGESAKIYTFPVLQSFRLANVGGFLSRLEALPVFFIMLLVLSKAGLGAISSIKTFEKAFKIKNKSIFLGISLFLAGVLVLNLFSFVVEVNNFLILIYPFLALIFAIIIPFLAIILIKIKEKISPKEYGEN